MPKPERYPPDMPDAARRAADAIGNPTRVHIIRALSARTRLSRTHLAEELNISRAGASLALDILVQHGYVVPDDGDYRGGQGVHRYYELRHAELVRDLITLATYIAAH